MKSRDKKEKREIIVGHHYKLLSKLGKGAFGEIYRCIHIKQNKEFAVKLENRKSKYPQLAYEYKLYNYLHDKDKFKDTGIPKVYYFNKEGNYNVMVMDMLGKSLEDLNQKCKGKFSLKTVLMVGEQMIERIKYFHKRHFLHRDIKPDNFMMGIDKKRHKVYIIDFGLAKRFLRRDGKHIPYKDGKDLTGTARYASINTHAGVEQGRRDDLESLGYVLLYFLRGKLPWQGMPGSTKKEKYRNIMNKKIHFALDQLCKGFPDEFIQYIEYCRQLKFEEKPDYDFLTKLFQTVMGKKSYKKDYIYDWDELASKYTSQRSHKDRKIKKSSDFKYQTDKKKKYYENTKKTKNKSMKIIHTASRNKDVEHVYAKKRTKTYNLKKNGSKARNKHDGEAGYTLQNLINRNKNSKYK